MVEYWETRRGLKKGDVPNKAKLLYKSYKTWLEREFGGEERPVNYKAFFGYLKGRGYQQVCIRHVTCWLLNKAVVAA